MCQATYARRPVLPMEVTSAGICSSIVCALLLGGCFADGPPPVRPEPMVNVEDDAEDESSSSEGSESDSSSEGSTSGSSSSEDSSSSTGEPPLCFNGSMCNPDSPGDAEIGCWCMCDLPGEPLHVGPCVDGEECQPVPVSEKWESLYGDVEYCVPG